MKIGRRVGEDGRGVEEEEKKKMEETILWRRKIHVR